MDAHIFDIPSTSDSAAAFLLRSERMTTDYFSTDLHTEYTSGCNCPPPPDLNWRPPPDPSLIFGDLFEDDEFLSELRNECGVDFPSLIPVDMIPKEMEPMREYLAFLISAILTMILVLTGAVICCIYLRKSGKCWTLCKFSDSKGSRVVSSPESSVIGLPASLRPSDVTINGRTPPTTTVKETKWSYNSMKPTSAAQKLASRQPLHQASSLGLLMYGEDSSPQLPYSQKPAHHFRYIPSSHTLPRQPRNLAPATSLPAPFQQPNNGLQQTRLEPKPNFPVYEEISLKNGDTTIHFSQCNNIDKFRRVPARLPPPAQKPPPPPDLDSPGSSQSCSCSVGSASLDQELDGIQITPSPKRKKDTVPVHQSRSAYNDKSTQSNASSPQDTTVSDCCECSNGRESGYGTEGRSKSSNSRQKFASPNLHRRQKGANLKSPSKQLWVTVKKDLSPENPSNSSSTFRDLDDSSSLAVFSAGQKSHSSHSMTYV